MENISYINMDDRIAGMQQEADMQEMFKPVLKSNDNPRFSTFPKRTRSS